ncbi:MAG TPA: RNA ligase [Tepidisphaeraceae bacterium]|jgi:RNA ligase|nr:RNA ligase [Tepidisphaeraceae bacterium]
MALDPNLLAQLQGVHPARRMPLDALRAGLMQGAAEKRINISRDGDLELFNYSSLCQFEQQWDLFALIARGLILDPARRQVVATPFPKFFNFNEGGVALPDESFTVSEKFDGSLGILFYHHDKWRITTRGQLSSAQGAWATRHLHDTVDISRLSAGTTYLVEIVYKENKVVIPYDFEGLVLLAAYDPSGRELARSDLEQTAFAVGMRLAASVAFSTFDDLLNAAGRLTIHEEGYVLRFDGGLRVKLKGEAYCRVHKLICHCTPLALWESMMHAEDLDSRRHELPEEMRVDFDSIRRLLSAQFDALVDEVRVGHERTTGRNDKELGMILQDPNRDLTAMQGKFVFACRKGKFLDAVHAKGPWREKLFKCMRPDGNRLKGYVASSAMNRFAESSES